MKTTLTDANGYYTFTNAGDGSQPPQCEMPYQVRVDEAMKSDKKARLERAGWVVEDAARFLKLSAQEQRLVELKLALATGMSQ